MFPHTTLKEIPTGTELFENQVAGHTFQTGTDEIGMLRDCRDGSVLKGAAKPLCGKREIQFYEDLRHNISNASMLMLRELVPEYRGSIQIHIRGKLIDFIKLADLTHDMSKPCIMDIKIGERTWDPLATSDKIKAEEQKYAKCKKKLGFCIPGFQVYDIKNGRIKRFGKEYGKKLSAEKVKDALKVFLNANNQLSSTLLLKFLSTLRSIQKWARTQITLRLYSSSLLLVYDAEQFRSQLYTQQNYSFKGNSSNSFPGPSPPDTIMKPRLTSTSCITEDIAALQYAGQIVDNSGCVNEKKLNDRHQEENNFNQNGDCDTSNSIQLYKHLQRCNSTQNHFEEGTINISKDYCSFLDNIVGDRQQKDSKEWAFIKMIDFAHVFPAENESIDTNYLFGIESLINIFEQLLSKCSKDNF